MIAGRNPLAGYRDAQCGWIMIDEHSSDQGNDGDGAQKRQALFLVIYASRRGILEVLYVDLC